MRYDPDVAHAAAFNNHQDVAVPSKINEPKLMTKIDIRVIPVLSVLYLMAFLDRTNIANAVRILSKLHRSPLTDHTRLSLSSEKTSASGDWSITQLWSSSLCPISCSKSQATSCSRS